MGFAVAVFGEEAGGEVEVGDGGQFAVFLIVGRVGAAVGEQVFGTFQQEGEVAQYGAAHFLHGLAVAAPFLQPHRSVHEGADFGAVVGDYGEGGGAPAFNGLRQKLVEPLPLEPFGQDAGGVYDLVAIPPHVGAEGLLGIIVAVGGHVLGLDVELFEVGLNGGDVGRELAEGVEFALMFAFVLAHVVPFQNRFQVVCRRDNGLPEKRMAAFR